MNAHELNESADLATVKLVDADLLSNLEDLINQAAGRLGVLGRLAAAMPSEPEAVATYVVCADIEAVRFQAGEAAAALNEASRAYYEMWSSARDARRVAA